MKVTKQELKDFGLVLPQPFDELTAGNYFVFYYRVDEENLNLIISRTEIVKQINVSLYRGMVGSGLKVGFFSDTFETRDGLFYQFLRTYNPIDKISTFYSFVKEQDRIVDLNVSTDSVNNIYSSEDFRRTISYFSPSRIQTIMFVYDMVDHVFSKKLSKSLYGDMLKKVVNLVKFDGGVLPEINGTLRFMVIGQNAVLNEQQKENLQEAKLLARSMQDLEKIYQYTGWALSDKDGKWRTNIADNEASIDKALLYVHDGRKLYIPKGQTTENVLNIISNPEKLYNYNYNGRLIEVLKHPTLYEYYPRLALLPLLYYYGEKPSGKEDYYFSPNERGGYILINGYQDRNDSTNNSLSILLHEIQHYIQRVEGYATGGNLFFAQFVASVGSSSVRKIFACINKMEKYFREDLFSDSARIEIIDVLKNQLPKTSNGRQLKNMLLEYLNDKEEYKNNYKTINFYLVLFVAEEGDFSTNDIVLYLQKKLGDIVFELFENITDGYDSAKKYQEKLSFEGYKKDDISYILFKGYENLYGELESRSVQSSRLIGSEFKNYFSLTKWENAPLQQITVIDGVEEIIDCTKIKAAVESKDGEYVLHFQKTNTCVPFLHELAHILHDALNQLGYSDRIKEEFDKDVFSENLDEYFVLKFLGYLKVRIDDSKIIDDMRMDFSIKDNPKINEILDEFFADIKVSERLNFLQTVLSV
jgi:hypothetical protein